ncbi:MAG: hypothetical protein CXT73_07220, partial [Methanobacteriota archaeon]
MTKDEDIIAKIVEIYNKIIIGNEMACNKDDLYCFNLAIKEFIKEEYHLEFKKIAFESIIEKLSVKKKIILFDNRDKLQEGLKEEIKKFFDKFEIDDHYLIPNF